MLKKPRDKYQKNTNYALTESDPMPCSPISAIGGGIAALIQISRTRVRSLHIYEKVRKVAAIANHDSESISYAFVLTKEAA